MELFLTGDMEGTGVCPSSPQDKEREREREFCHPSDTKVVVSIMGPLQPHIRVSSCTPKITFGAVSLVCMLVL